MIVGLGEEIKKDENRVVMILEGIKN